MPLLDDELLEDDPVGASSFTRSADSWALDLTSSAAWVALSFSYSPTSWAAAFAWSITG